MNEGSSDRDGETLAKKKLDARNNVSISQLAQPWRRNAN